MIDLNEIPKYKFDVWNAWTHRSKHIPFNKIKNNNGDGEDKLAAEFNTKPLGQNSTHDLDVNNEKWEVKKLDTDNSFNLGVEAYSKFVLDFVVPIASLFKKLDEIEGQLISINLKQNISNLIHEFNSSWKNGRTHNGITIRDGLPRGELSQNNLNKLNELIKQLKLITNVDNSKIKLYSSNTGEKKLYTSEVAMQKINLEEISYDAKIQIFENEQSYDRIYLASKIHEYLNEFKDIDASEKLTIIVRSMFDDLRLVFVDKKLGFKPIDKKIDNVTCYRITRKTPRCLFID